MAARAMSPFVHTPPTTLQSLRHTAPVDYLHTWVAGVKLVHTVLAGYSRSVLPTQKCRPLPDDLLRVVAWLLSVLEGLALRLLALLFSSHISAVSWRRPDTCVSSSLQASAAVCNTLARRAGLARVAMGHVGRDRAGRDSGMHVGHDRRSGHLSCLTTSDVANMVAAYNSVGAMHIVLMWVVACST